LAPRRASWRARRRGRSSGLSKTIEMMRRRPVAWFFAIAFSLEVVVVAVFLFSGAAQTFDAARQAAGLENRTDFVAAYRLAVEAQQAIPGIALSILQPFTPDIAAFVVARLAFGSLGLVRLLRGFRFWSAGVGWRRGLLAWGLMLLAFLFFMPLATAGLDALFMPKGTWEWSGHALDWGLFPALLIGLFLNVGAVSEESGWRGFAQPVLQARNTPLAAALIVGVLWGVWHFPARPDILMGAYGLYGGALLLGILVVRFVFLSVVMAYFYNRAGGSTLIAIAMHGLHNDSVLFSGTITGSTLASYAISELALLAPIAVVAVAVLCVSGRDLALTESARWKT
jgi:membrane protease YdiL (CAAX protease family)